MVVFLKNNNDQDTTDQAWTMGLVDDKDSLLYTT